LSKPSHGRSSLQDLLRIVDEAADLGFTEIKLTGGEPLLSRHAFEVADRAKRRGLWVNLLTNATLVTPERAARLAEVIDSVSISLDSDQADVHDAVRGRGTYRRILEAVKSLKQCGVTVLHVNCVVTPVNLGSTAKFLDFAWNILGANKVTVGEAIPAVGDSEKSTEKYLLSSNERQQLTQIIREFDEGRLSSGACVQARTDMWRRHCGAGNGEISVDPNGDVYPCQTMHLPEFFCGNAFESGLKAVLQSEVLGKMKTLVVDNLPECRKCAVRYICAGACRCEAYLREGDLSARPREMCPVLFERCVDALWNAAAIPVERSAEALERYRTEQCGLEHGDIVRAVANSSQ
jgi:radical SAM protein with 4Fe4S-binding SPASM domain